MNSPSLDQRFLRPSPELQRWLQEIKPQCMRCTHCTAADGKGMRCSKGDGTYCIDMREQGGKCGLSGKFFSPTNT